MSKKNKKDIMAKGISLVLALTVSHENLKRRGKSKLTSEEFICQWIDVPYSSGIVDVFKKIFNEDFIDHSREDNWTLF